MNAAAPQRCQTSNTSQTYHSSTHFTGRSVEWVASVSLSSAWTVSQIQRLSGYFESRMMSVDSTFPVRIYWKTTFGVSGNTRRTIPDNIVDFTRQRILVHYVSQESHAFLCYSVQVFVVLGRFAQFSMITRLLSLCKSVLS